jgi:hypothetical protein
LTFSNDTEKIDDPLRKPEKPTVEEEEEEEEGAGGGGPKIKKPDNETTMRTIELEKTLYNIGNLL